MNTKLTVEWDSYELPSCGSDGRSDKKYGIVGGLGVISDEILSRISKDVDVIAVGARHIRGKDLPLYEEVDGYKEIRPLCKFDSSEVTRKCKELFETAGVGFYDVHAGEIPVLPFLADYTFAIPEVITNKKPDLICAHDWMAILGSYQKALSHAIPLVVFLHSLESGRAGGIIHTLNGPQENDIYAGRRTIRDIEVIGIKKADVCFTVGKNMVEEVKKVGVKHGIPKEEIEKKTYPIHHGVDSKTYKPIIGVEKEYDVIFIGRFAYVKGVMELLNATKILRNKFPDIKVKLIGGGEMERDVYDWIVKEKMEKNILVSTKWHTPKEKAIEINKAKIAVAPSKYEPHGQFDLEAGACGIPCINGTGGFMERMINNYTALQCNPFDPRDIADKIEFLLENEERIEEIGRNARHFIEKHYDWDKRAKIYPEIFEAIVSDDLKRLYELPLIVPLERKN
jgi:glycogen(starch) synthase